MGLHTYIKSDQTSQSRRLSSAPLKTVENGNSHGKLNLTISTLKLLIFNPNTKDEAEVSLRVPIPRVLIDVESPVQFRALNDHVEVKLVLLLPVDRPILATFDSDFSENESRLENAYSDDSRPLLMDSDIKSLSATGEVKFYCRSCSTQLTRSLRKYTLERMFINQLLENAKDELSFRTVVRDLQTNSAMLQIIL